MIGDGFGAGHIAERLQRRLRRRIGAEARTAGLHRDRRHVDHMSRPPGNHVRQESEDEVDRAEVVDRHDPVIVVGALHRVHGGAPDGPAGVVDQHVDVTVLRQYRFDQRVDRFLVGDVALIRHRTAGRDALLAGRRIQFGGGGIEFVGRSGHDDHVGATCDAHPGGGLPDAARPAGDENVLAHERAAGVATPVAGTVEVRRPVLPQAGVRIRRIRGTPIPCSWRTAMVASEEKSTGSDTASSTAGGMPCWVARRLRPTRAGPIADSASTGSTMAWGRRRIPPGVHRRTGRARCTSR